MYTSNFIFYNDNTDEIDLDAIRDCYCSSEAMSRQYFQDGSELSAEELEYLNDVEREWEYEFGVCLRRPACELAA